jgi:hypothetical protein
VRNLYAAWPTEKRASLTAMRCANLASFFVSSVSVLTLAGCGSSAPSGPVGGAVNGAMDMHCVGDGAIIAQKVGLCICMPSPKPALLCSTTPQGGSDGSVDGEEPGDDGGPDASGDDGSTSTSDYGETMYNDMGSDDDCKYDVIWSSTPIRENVDVTFTVTVKRRADDDAAETSADVTPEIFLDVFTPADTARSTSKETPAGSGSYVVGPVRFTKAGQWTVRFHFNESCSDENEDSPHGHAAFYVNVP